MKPTDRIRARKLLLLLALCLVLAMIAPVVVLAASFETGSLIQSWFLLPARL